MPTNFPPVRKEIVVEAPAERAFRVFTDGFGKWWPRGHHIGKVEMENAVIEPRAGGRWYEIGTDGSQCDWGKVLVWDPPRRLLLGWQLDGDWQYDPNLLTEVELRFTSLGPMQTRVELEHRDLERFGEKAESTRQAIDSEQGWGMLLSLFAEAANKERVTV